MLTANLKTVELRDSKSPTDDSLQVRVTFPVSAFQGAADSAVVYFEVEPGKRLGNPGRRLTISTTGRNARPA